MYADLQIDKVVSSSKIWRISINYCLFSSINSYFNELFYFQAETNGSVWAMDRQTFRKIVLKSAFQKRKMYESFLENVQLLESLEVYLFSHHG